MDYFDQITQFLAQYRTTKLGTNEYLKNYLGLKVKVSFGQGRKALIPWIAFLKDANTVSDGIYPVYLYYADIETLILAYGVSQKFSIGSLKKNWHLESAITLQEYFKTVNYSGLVRYDNSFFYKSYNTKNIERERVEKDLIEIIEVYKAT